MSLKKISKLPSQELLKELLEYRNGKLYWKFVDIKYQLEMGVAKRERSAKTRNTKYAHKEAGHEFLTTSGTLAHQVRILNKSYYTHRVIYKLLTGEEPLLIDHINGNPVDNRIENLRSVSNQENARNTKMFNTNTSGHVGVSFMKAASKWEAYIWDNYRKINLGLFKTKEEAVEAREKAQLNIGFHENHGKR